MDRISWDATYMTMAAAIAMRSPDPSSTIGAVIATADNVLVSAGYNGWPRGIAPFDKDDPRWNRPEKYFWMAHAERNAIDNAARNGSPLNGCTLYCLIAPCAECAKGIIQVGIKRVVIYSPAMDAFCQSMQSSQTWVDGLKASKRMFEEAQIDVDTYDGPIELNSITINGAPYMLQKMRVGMVVQTAPIVAKSVKVGV